MLIGGVLLFALHGVSDIGIYGPVLDLIGFVLFLIFVCSAAQSCSENEPLFS